MNRGEIRTLTRFWLNEATAGFFSDPDLNTLINIGNQKVNRKIAALDEDFFTVSQTFPTVANTKSYTLPVAFRGMVRLEHYNAADASDIDKIDSLPFPRSEGSGAWPFSQPGKPRRYILRDDQIDLWPIPDAVYTLRMYFDNRQNDFSADADVPSSPLDFHELIALWTTILALPANHEGSDEYKTLYANGEIDLIESISGRKTRDPQTVEGYLEGWSE